MSLGLSTIKSSSKLRRELMEFMSSDGRWRHIMAILNIQYSVKGHDDYYFALAITDFIQSLRKNQLYSLGLKKEIDISDVFCALDIINNIRRPYLVRHKDSMIISAKYQEEFESKIMGMAVRIALFQTLNVNTLGGPDEIISDKTTLDSLMNALS